MPKGTSLKPLLLSFLLTTLTLCYLQLQIQRYQLRTQIKNSSPITCITKEIDKQLDEEQKKEKQEKKQKAKKKKDDQDEDDDQDDEEQIDDDKIEEKQNYKEICYQKDISYSLPIYVKDKLNLISLDTTVPISWFKGQNCHIEATSKKCSTITTNLKDKISKIFKNKEKKKTHSSDQYAIIEGSSQLVKGIEQRGKNFQFITRDSSRLTVLSQILMLGFYMKSEKDTVQLENTNFINATQISKNLNYLCDGAISLRLDNKSESSFLKQLIEYQNNKQKYVTIYIDKQGSSFVAIGDIASKYSQTGYGGIEWIEAKDDENYGKLPVITDIIIQNEGSKFSEIRQKQYPAVISLSASYIGIPKLVMAEWLKKFNKKSNCQVNQNTKYLECKHLKQKDESKIITFQFSGKKISFTLSELIMGKSGGKTVLNMKQTLHDEYAILGEPVFKKYLIVFDYNNNRVGISQKRAKSQAQFISVVAIIRFVCIVFLFGCSFIFCYIPIKHCLETIKKRTIYAIKSQNKGQTRRLKQYSPIQENPYDELSSKVKQVLQPQQQHH